MVEIQDIFQQHGEHYRKAHKLTLVQHKAMSAIQRCRTGELGAHVDVCENCGVAQISYNSCRNRHCPKCQMLSKERWIESRKSDLLNVGYFHVVFTLPSELRSVLYQNQVALYNLLFRAVAETLQELAGNPKFLGARLGFTSILHTWGQNLSYHPHIHCIIPGGWRVRQPWQVERFPQKVFHTGQSALPIIPWQVFRCAAPCTTFVSGRAEIFGKSRRLESSAGLLLP